MVLTPSPSLSSLRTPATATRPADVTAAPFPRDAAAAAARCAVEEALGETGRVLEAAVADALERHDVAAVLHLIDVAFALLLRLWARPSGGCGEGGGGFYRCEASGDEEGGGKRRKTEWEEGNVTATAHCQLCHDGVSGLCELSSWMTCVWKEIVEGVLERCQDDSTKCTHGLLIES